MRKDLVKLDIKSSFLSCEKDFETIMRKLFIESRPFSDILKRLLIIETKDCLDNQDSQIYKDKINNTSIKNLLDEGYIRLAPIIKLPEHEEVKSYILIGFDNFTPDYHNPQFRDCVVTFDVICNTDYWDIGNYRMRPLKICGYIDGILNNSKLSGIGTLQFLGCSKIVLDEKLSGYSLIYSATHGSDDWIADGAI
jgi:hypothetical protein